MKTDTWYVESLKFTDGIDREGDFVEYECSLCRLDGLARPIGATTVRDTAMDVLQHHGYGRCVP